MTWATRKRIEDGRRALTAAAANRAADDLIGAIVQEIKISKKFTLSSFGRLPSPKLRRARL